MDNIITTPFKFLGGFITASGSSVTVSNILKESIVGSDETNGIIMNIDASPIRGEYKCEIYRIYVQDAIRYLLTVHDISRTHLLELNSSVTQYLKKWANMVRSANPGILYHSQGLGLTSVEQIYQQQHASVIASAMTVGDSRVKNALAAKVQRETALRRKSTGTVTNHALVEGVLTTVMGNEPHETQTNPQSTKEKVCQKVKTRLRKEEDMKVEEKCRSLQVQGNWVELVIQEQSDLKWKSSLCNTPRGVFEFALNGMLNWLPTADNLVRWGKVLSPKCPLCKGRQTLRHVLNMCPVALKDRYTWRHNSVLMELVSTLKLWHAKSNPEVIIRCDLSPDYLEGGTHTTIPPDILPTPLVPDITVQDPVKRTLTLIELTVPFDQNAQDAEDRKSA
ncbi:uncharacterized protein LOC144927246 [Branchiostoma floridae x Branchiostoma belcheri]